MQSLTTLPSPLLDTFFLLRRPRETQAWAGVEIRKGKVRRKATLPSIARRLPSLSTPLSSRRPLHLVSPGRGWGRWMEKPLVLAWLLVRGRDLQEDEKDEAGQIPSHHAFLSPITLKLP